MFEFKYYTNCGNVWLCDHCVFWIWFFLQRMIKNEEFQSPCKFDRLGERGRMTECEKENFYFFFWRLWLIRPWINATSLKVHEICPRHLKKIWMPRRHLMVLLPWDITKVIFPIHWVLFRNVWNGWD